MGETYVNPHEVHTQGDSSDTPPGGSTIGTIDGSVDEPPIRSAGSSQYLTEKPGGETRCKEHKPTIAVRSNHDYDELATVAHTLTGAEVARRLQTDADKGLSENDCVLRREKHGHNKLESSGGVTWYKILLRQVSNSLTLVLAIAMALSYGTGDFIEGGVITAVIVLNIVVGFFQDYRAEQTIQSLRAMAAPACRVIRENGTMLSIKAEDLVLGDIVQLATGDIVPADLRLYTSINLATDEALLTGESKPCTKDALKNLSHTDAPLGDRVNMAYSSTTVTRGRAQGIVTATGMNTEIGKIAQLLRDKKGYEDSSSFISRLIRRVIHGLKSALGLIGTPLQVKLSYFALLLFALAILLAIIVFSTSLWDIDGETLIYGICVAVAVIPESLIAVLTITMAIGSKAMAASNVIVRKQAALEAVGGVTNICSDKTGTLTQGKMLARKALLPSGRLLTVVNELSPFDPTCGDVLVDSVHLEPTSIDEIDELRYFFSTIALCNMSNVIPPQDDQALWSATGEPTEIALHVLARRVRQGKDEILSQTGMSLLTEHSFDSSVKRMSVVYSLAGRSHGIISFTKGATEALLPLLRIEDGQRGEILHQVDTMASEGLRVLCLGYRRLDETDSSSIAERAFVEAESFLTFAGLVGLYDPPRLESAGAIKQCQAAGIVVHMLTGDHLKTATTIAKEIGILGPDVYGSNAQTAVMTAMDFDKLTDDALDVMDPLPFVLARCSPTTKLRMLEALHRRGRYCVMTGDGVNDSPALKGADVGVAMGLNGSDVSKEAADMVLTDDNFASIVSAIREGRRLFDNIQKFLLHLLISNISQVILLLIGLAFKDRHNVSVFPLSPIEILWANLLTSSFLAIGLGMEEASADVMIRAPHSLKAGVFTKELIVDKFVYGTFMGALCLASYVIVAFGVGDGDLGFDCNESYNSSCDLPYRARGTAYSVLTVLLSVMAWEAKHLTLGLFNMDRSTSFMRNLMKNHFLFYSVCAGLLTPIPIIYIPVVNRQVFRHTALTWEWGLVYGSVVLFVSLVEAWKAVKRRKGYGKRTLSEKYIERSDNSSCLTAV
ncbi:Na(+)/Li(+)-exporting P-type ATPase [Aureobasidium sp. EXF-10728]|nr:Na(+)/Li(+)-exporting P-type ATPase [Aureobasidium sp. EXF-10728]